MNELMIKQTLDSREVAEMMGVNHYDLLKKIEGAKDRKGYMQIIGDKNEYFIQNTYKDASGKMNKKYNITPKGIKLILDNTRNYKNKEKLYKYYNNLNLENNEVILYNREEIDFINMLEDALKPFGLKGIKQYKVKSYRIDYYIESANIAIEYDEADHINYSYEKHEGRQREIEKELGCRFIRISNNDNNAYNIGKVIKEIFNL